MSAEDNLNTRKRYSSYGLWAGLSLGIFVGVVAGGSRFREWENPLYEWGTLIVACAAVGAIVGFIFFSLVRPGLDSSGVGGGSGSDGWGGHGGGDGDGGGGD